jgi:hypothetical protein
MRTSSGKALLIVAMSLFSALTVLAQTAIQDSAWGLSEYRTTSFVQLLANPDRFHGRKVTILGYLHWRFEDASLYLSKLDADYMNSANAVWVRLADSVRWRTSRPTRRLDLRHSLAYFDGKYVSLTGVFNHDERGHLGGFAGTLDSVYVISEMPRIYDGKARLK